MTAWDNVQLARSILEWATPETAAKAAEEARAALDGATLEQLIERREKMNATFPGTLIEDRPALKGDFVYTVQWPDGVTKIGYASARYRWRKFVCRGAELAQLVRFDSCQEALEYENRAQESLSHNFPKAFKNRHEAKFHLGCDGGGWTECYRIQGGSDV